MDNRVLDADLLLNNIIFRMLNKTIHTIFALFQGTVDGGKWYEDVHQSLIQEWLEVVTGEFMKMECIGKNAIAQVTVVILEHQLGITIIECV